MAYMNTRLKLMHRINWGGANEGVANPKSTWGYSFLCMYMCPIMHVILPWLWVRSVRDSLWYVVGYMYFHHSQDTFMYVVTNAYHDNTASKFYHSNVLLSSWKHQPRVSFTASWRWSNWFVLSMLKLWRNMELIPSWNHWCLTSKS